ncbi:YesK-like protein [Gracilibacillus ureilyticus]|uniref:YesK-like protein n=1 Tax=Gracilibacillus ureilyticus TaxID=531814 RepID=A0A1H9UYZ5_9BACI|nr:YesK family protein [Gracilibacillus ureilyticus]SES14579.1 YesK-like protein [Gracilibacillus ureilyticus]
MHALYLEGWLPIILVCFFVATFICLLAKFIKRVVLYIVSAALIVIFSGLFLYSIFGIGRWDGMAIGIYSVSALIGTAIGTGISPLIKYNN